MKQTTAANLALVLVALAWPLAFYGALSQLGDPSPSVPRAQIEATRHLSLAILCTGVLGLFGSLWLSGAILITIMVLELKVPHDPDFRALLPLWPVFMSYVLSFVYIGIYWNKLQYVNHPSSTHFQKR